MTQVEEQSELADAKVIPYHLDLASPREIIFPSHTRPKIQQTAVTTAELASQGLLMKPQHKLPSCRSTFNREADLPGAHERVLVLHALMRVGVKSLGCVCHMPSLKE